MNATELVREVTRELSELLLVLPANSAARSEASARILDRCCEELAEAAAMLRST